MSELNEVERGQLCQSTIESLYEATGGLKQFPGLLKRIIASKAWERRMSKGKVIELASLRELITEKPVRGWGEDPKKVEAVIKDDPEALVMFREAMKTHNNQHTRKCDNVTPAKGGEGTGNSRAYSIDRVKRECDEETIAAVMADKIKPHAALVKAGIKRDRQLYINKSMEDFADNLRKKLTEDELKELGRLLNDKMGE
jgi:hypothetical protein